jgi:6-phosphogluconate dehydrogenase
MQLGMVGLGRMGGNLARRLVRHGHACIGFDPGAAAVKAFESDGGRGVGSLADLIAALEPPRCVWLMIPATAVDALLGELAPRLSRGDIVIEGGNSHYLDSVRRARSLDERGLHFVDVGTSGGIWGLERGYCLMIGGDAEIVRHLDPIFAALAPGLEAAPRTTGAPGGSAEQGYLHCGSHGSGHFVKMIHNGIEYGLMEAYAEGFNLLRSAGAPPEGSERSPGSEDLPRYALDLPAIAELWRRGSVVGSWLLDLAAQALHQDPVLDDYAGRVADSGECRWTVQTAVERGVPVPALSAALYARFRSRGQAEFGDRLLSALRRGFGGHLEAPPRPGSGTAPTSDRR